MSDESIQVLLDKIRGGDDDAVALLWDQCFPSVVRQAMQRLQGERARQADGEDVGLSVMKSLVVALREGRMPDLDDKEGLWRLLRTMTCRKVIDLVRYNKARQALGESVLDAPGSDEARQHGMQQIQDDQLKPDLAAEVDAECTRLVALLPREDLRETAIRRLEGYTVKEIAEMRDRHISTIERHLKLIRKYWAEKA